MDGEVCSACCECGAVVRQLRGWHQKPNVVVLLMDTLRADRLGCYGYGRNTSPTVDAIARRGVIFTRCYAPSDYTQASTASLFTGKYPLAHGYINSNYVLEEANQTMAEILGQAGYRTAAFIANGLAGEKYQMDQGFEHHVEQDRAAAAELVERAAEFIGEDDGPFFYLHDLHALPRRPRSPPLPVEHLERFADRGFAHGHARQRAAGDDDEQSVVVCCDRWDTSLAGHTSEGDAAKSSRPCARCDWTSSAPLGTRTTCRP